MPVDPSFWAGRRVLVTGHTGFKGSWLVLWLRELGAEVIGLADGTPTSPSLFDLARAGEGIADVRADVRDPDAVASAFAEHRPEVVLHLAAQPIVRRSFREPREAFEINTMGTVNVLDAVRATPGVEAVVCITSDKCYDNAPGRPPRPFVEDDPMGGHDPYSSSKGCAELVVHAYRHSYFDGAEGPRIASARAGNVIGGGDWAADRLIPDLMRAAAADEVIPVRNPDAVRPWQHVLNPLSGYLVLAQAVAGDPEAQGGWNFGPAPEEAEPVRWIADRIGERWPRPLRWAFDPGPHPAEAGFLALDSSKARDRLGWSPAWDLPVALDAVVAWHVALEEGADMREVTLGQIRDFAAAAG